MSAHKFHGPCGIGALLLRTDVPIEPILFGGVQQGGFRPGTEPVALVLGMFSALRIWHRDAVNRTQRMRHLRDRLEILLARQIPGMIVHGSAAERLPQTSNISFPGANRQAMMIALDLAGLACSTGSACASGSSRPSSVLQAMGLSELFLEGALRFSLGALTTEPEVDQAVLLIVNVYNELQSCRYSSNALPPSRHAAPEEI